MAQPDLIPMPFAENATPGTIEPIPATTPTVPQDATWSTGFPQITMQPLASGGQPPRGQNFNGVLNALSQHIFHMQGGGQYKWDATFAAADGYPLGAVLQKAGNDGFWLNLLEGNATNPDTGGANWIDASSTTLPYALDTGAANAYVANYAPALSALATGQVVRFKASNANTGASTFNPNGLGAKPIVTLDGSALPAGSIQANGHVWLQYDATVGGGSWVSLLSTGADTLNANQASIAVASTVNLTTGAPNTSHVLLTGGGTVNNFTVDAGRTYFVTLGAATTLTVSASIDTGNTRSIVGRLGDTLILYSTAANTVRVIMHQPRDGWANLNSGNGYQFFPSGLVLQWGVLTNSATPGGPTAVVFPISLSVVRQVSNTADAATASNAAAWVDNQNTTGFNSRCAAANAASRWIAVGFI